MVYLIGIQFVFKESSFAHPVFSIALDGLAWLFWLASFACIAAIVNLFNDYGLDGPGVLNALLAFGIIEWYVCLLCYPTPLMYSAADIECLYRLLFSATLGFAIFAFLRGRGSKGSAPAQGV